MKTRQIENVSPIGMEQEEGKGRTQGRPSMSKQSKAKNNSWHPSMSRARQVEHAGSTWAEAQREERAVHAKATART